MDGYSAGRVLGPLAPYADGFVVGLIERGYRPRSVSCQLELMAHLSRWLGEQGVEPDGLTPAMAERFLEVRREGGGSLKSWRALDPLVGYLRGLGVVPKLAASADSWVDRLLAGLSRLPAARARADRGLGGSLGARREVVPG